MYNTSISLYENRDDVTLSHYLIDDSPELLNGKKRPAVLICPGGGYLFCSDREAQPVALRFASMGYHAFVLRYSTFHRAKHPSWEKDLGDALNPDCQYPNPMRDIGKAFLYLQSKAEEWQIDTDRIAICGFSAGAHNCAMYSVYWQDPVIHQFFNEDPTLFKPAAAILCYGTYNYQLMMEFIPEITNPMLATIRESSAKAYFGTSNPDKQQLKIASPALHINQNTPPCFLWATTQDMLVPVQQTCEMATALAKAKIPFEVHIYENGPHGLSLANQASAGNKYEIDSTAAQWVNSAERWLENRFSLPLEEMPLWMKQKETAVSAAVTD